MNHFGERVELPLKKAYKTLLGRLLTQIGIF